MPRGSCASFMVLVTFRSSLSLNETGLLFSFATIEMNAKAGVAAESPAVSHAAVPESRQRRHMLDLPVFDAGRFNAACIWFRADRRRAYRVPRIDAGTPPAVKPTRPCVRRPAGWAGEAADSSPAASAAGL